MYMVSPQPRGLGAGYIVLRRCHVIDLDSSRHPRIKPPLNQGPRCGFLGPLGNLLEHTRSGVTAATGGGRSVPLFGRSVQDGPHMGSSLMGACVSSCRFQNVLIHVKRSPDEGVMPVLPNRALRLISTDSGLRIWQLIYLFRSSR
jgi:hypothetical protein